MVLPVNQLTLRDNIPLVDPKDVVKKFEEDEIAKIPLSDRQLMAPEIRQLCQKIYQTISYLTAKGASHVEILKQVRLSIDVNRSQLASARAHFKTAYAAYTIATTHFDQTAASANTVDFSDFTLPQKTFPNPIRKLSAKIDQAEAECLGLAKKLPLNEQPNYKSFVKSEAKQIRNQLSAMPNTHLDAIADTEIQGRVLEMKVSAVLHIDKDQKDFPGPVPSDDGSIKPWSRLFLFFQSKNQVKNVEKKRALVLTANQDSNGAFTLSLFSHRPQTEVFYSLERDYNIKYRKVSDITTFCGAIDVETKRKGPIDLLIIRGHGSMGFITFDKDKKLKVGDSLPKESCLNSLAPGATIILDSCQTGKGKEEGNNLANYLAGNSPPGTRIISPTEDATKFTVSKNDPIEVHFVNDSHSHDITYVIDANNKTKDDI